jgi:23S rRNA (uracil1939-C5)-methyltransferase
VIPTDDCLAAHPLVAELLIAGRFHGAEEVVLRAGVASGERVAMALPSAARFEVPSGVITVRGSSREAGAIHEEVAGRRLRVSARSFFQSGPAAANALVDVVAREVDGRLDGASHLVDAYAGVGLFGSVLGSRFGCRVTAIERDRAALADARVNLRGIDHHIVAVEVGRWRPERADVVVADPARTGLGRPGVTALAAASAARLVLVSCDPASLGRDAVLLQREGYRLSALAVVDAFPHTFHVETVATFDR